MLINRTSPFSLFKIKYIILKILRIYLHKCKFMCNEKACYGKSIHIVNQKYIFEKYMT